MFLIKLNSIKIWWLSGLSLTTALTLVVTIARADSVSATIPAGAAPLAVAVNPVTNKIYVANNGSANVTVIDGSNNMTQTVAVGTSPRAVVVNPVTNKIYVPNGGSNNVTVIDGNDNSTQTVTAGTNPQAVAVSSVTNKIYVANTDSANVTVIDGSDNSTQTVPAEANMYEVAVNPVTNKVYVGNYLNSANVTVITPTPVQTIPLTVDISPLPNNTTSLITPTFSFTATSSYSPTAPSVQQIYYQVDTWTGQWLQASPAGSNSSGTTPPLQPGIHIIYAFAVDGQEATSINTGRGSSPIPGQISAYLFLVDRPLEHVYLPIVLKN